jgi:mannose-6-phosphate isomerase-like protein (cupin superfamily)
MEPIPLETLALSHRAARFEGKDHGTPISFFVTNHAPGEGPSLHRHPYPETFIVQQGTVAFAVGDTQVVTSAGNVVVVPADTWHGFTNTGDEPLRQVSVHASPEVIQEFLDE